MHLVVPKAIRNLRFMKVEEEKINIMHGILVELGEAVYGIRPNKIPE